MGRSDHNSTLGHRLLAVDDFLSAAGLKDSHEHIAVARLEVLLNVGSGLIVFVSAATLLKVGQAEVLTAVAIGGHQRKVTTILFFADVHDLVIIAEDEGHVDVVGGGAELFLLLAGENVCGNEVALGVAVLASLGGGDIHDLARLSLDHDEAALADLASFHRLGVGGAGITSGIKKAIKPEHPAFPVSNLQLGQKDWPAKPVVHDGADYKPQKGWCTGNKRENPLYAKFNYGTMDA